MKRLSGNISSSNSNKLAKECHLNKEAGDCYVYVDTQSEEIKVLKVKTISVLFTELSYFFCNFILVKCRKL